MENGDRRTPGIYILSSSQKSDDPFAWDALIVLRYTGRRLEDVAHLQQDCLRFDEDGDPYIFMDHRISKTSMDLSIPISHLGNLVVDAIRRQQKGRRIYLR